jgi:hypothetical protein
MKTQLLADCGGHEHAAHAPPAAESGGAECGTWSTQFGKERTRISEIARILRGYGRGGDFRFCGNFLPKTRNRLTFKVKK